jgi:hypothetical protein
LAVVYFRRNLGGSLKTPEAVKRWAQSPPPWLIVRAPTRIDPTLPGRLHRGEIEALAQELNAERLLVDDWDARRAAAERGFKLAGTLAILEEAAVRGLVDIEEAVARLRATNFYATEEQYQITSENVRTRRQVQERTQTQASPAIEQGQNDDLRQDNSRGRGM